MQLWHVNIEDSYDKRFLFIFNINEILALSYREMDYNRAFIFVDVS
jgi:hypothetical protein